MTAHDDTGATYNNPHNRITCGGHAAGCWIAASAGPFRLQRTEAHFTGRAYEMHRHDTYAIGLTLEGVQSFHYRGSVRHSLPGNSFVLYPDEPHDGYAGTDRGFRYATIYIHPSVLRGALGDRPLPYIEGGVSNHERLESATRRILRRPDSRFEEEDALANVAEALLQAAQVNLPQSRRPFDAKAANRARACLDALPAHMTMAELERVADRSRWDLSRDFRAAFGTSPYRYLTMRRLETAMYMIGRGRKLAEVAQEAGFADQSHMTRQFTRAYGMPPNRWLRLQLGRRPAGPPHNRSRPGAQQSS